LLGAIEVFKNYSWNTSKKLLPPHLGGKEFIKLHFKLSKKTCHKIENYHQYHLTSLKLLSLELEDRQMFLWYMGDGMVHGVYIYICINIKEPRKLVCLESLQVDIKQYKPQTHIVFNMTKVIPILPYYTWGNVCTILISFTFLVQFVGMTESNASWHQGQYKPHTQIGFNMTLMCQFWLNMTLYNICIILVSIRLSCSL
jgi:hypothetical protein